MGERNADFFSHPAIAGRCTKSEESADEGVLGHGLAAISQCDLFNLCLNSGDIDFHWYSLRCPFIVVGGLMLPFVLRLR